MKIAVEKCGERNGQDRFVLVNADTGTVITTNDVSEPTLRRFLKSKGNADAMIDECLRKARKRFAKTVDEEESLDDFFTEIGLDET